MRVVLDTNILVRALIKPLGTVSPIVHYLRDGRYTLLYSDSLLEELVDVLGRDRIRKKYHLGSHDIATILALILLRGIAVVPDEQIIVCRDPKDNQILEAAVAGKADVIVSGDDDLLVLNPFQGIPIIGPAAFLSMLES